MACTTTACTTIPAIRFWNVAAGHVHVGSGLSVAEAQLLSEVTLNETLLYINRTVPEPGAALLMALACVGLGVVGRRRALR